MTVLSSEMLHASCVAVGEQAVLIEGLSGAGKSDLALRLIDRGAMLVSDDYTLVKRAGGTLAAHAAPNIAGRIEARGVGIVEMPYREGVTVALIVTLDTTPERLPAPDERRALLGVEVPMIALSGFEASAPIKLELALRTLAA